MKYNMPKLNSSMVFNHDGKNIHSETYSLLIDTHVKDEAEKDELFNALEVFSSN
jgi:hypothetical protein